MWITFTRGKQPRESDCCIIEKVPDIMAWLAIIDANTATTNVGQYKGPAHHLKIPHSELVNYICQMPMNVYIERKREERMSMWPWICS